MAPTSNAATAWAVWAVQKITTGPSAGNSCSASSPVSSGIWMSSSTTSTPPARTRSSTSWASAHSPATATSGIAASRRNQPLAGDRLVVGDQDAQRAVRRRRRSRARPRARHRSGSVTSATRACRPRRRSSASPDHHRRAPGALDDVDARCRPGARPRYAPGLSSDTTSCPSVGSVLHLEHDARRGGRRRGRA